MRRLLQLAVPLIVQNIFGYGITLVGVITVGHLGTYELSAAILGSSAMNITGFAFLVRHSIASLVHCWYALDTPIYSADATAHSLTCE